MNLHALRLFQRVAELGGVTKAAQDMNISQPAVTSQIKRLEKELGLQLLSPQGRGVLLTDIGVKLAEDAGRLFALERSIEESLEAYRQGHEGSLRIAATYLPANFLLPHLISAFKKAYPGVNVRFTTASSARVMDLLLRYEADLAFVGGDQQSHPLLVRTPWHEDEMWFVAHRGHRLAGRDAELADLLREPFVFREEGSFSREQLLALCRVRRLHPPRVDLEMNGFNELIRVVSDGYGIAYLSALEAKEAIFGGSLRRIFVEDARLTNPIGLYRRKESMQPHAMKFLEMATGESQG